ncbi:uncharacterized protein MELLADRAFT_60175 [Melampsora larici-populina 98AG31]|uniref:Uncharacterized protein n=1 Tax=Melampsora larici-populina (strain 98AG31 / pathotype 3-4-7) TaxID=747676 RepID=F4RAC9_MELLP|nr:uncharacterized protein MELLADRAFT_60175 [Melampsora larici-populina 98AG31]EGG10459.1 hypothetical protein MELLADRAFT_60175 [Melampsora larici-populina 98AG31]
MPPRKSSRVSSLERPNYSDSIRRSSSVGGKPRRSDEPEPANQTNSGRNTSSSGPRATESYLEITRAPLHQVERRTVREPKQYTEPNDLSRIVEVDSRHSDHSNRGGSRTSPVPSLGSICRGESSPSQNLRRFHRERAVPQEAVKPDQPTTDPSGILSRSIEKPIAEDEQHSLQETKPSGRRSSEHATHVILQPSLLQSNERNERSEQGQRQGSATISNTFITTLSPFLNSRRIIKDVGSPPLLSNVVTDMPNVVFSKPMPASEAVIQVPEVPVRNNNTFNSKTSMPTDNVFKRATIELHNKSLSIEQNEIKRATSEKNKINENSLIKPFPNEQSNKIYENKTKSIEEILKETEHKVSPFTIKGLPRTTSPLSSDKEFSLNTKFKHMRLQTESLSPKSIASIENNESNLESKLKELHRNVQDEIHQSTRLLSQKWDKCIHIINDEIRNNLDDIKSNVNQVDIEKMLAVHLEEVDDMISNEIISHKEIIEANCGHLAGLINEVHRKLEDHSHNCSLIHQNVIRIVSMIDKLENKITSQRVEEEHYDIEPEEVVGNNPFAHEFVKKPVTHPPERAFERPEPKHKNGATISQVISTNSPSNELDEQDATIESKSRTWYNSKKKTTKGAPWLEWKKLIKEQFGTDLWKKKMGTAFERDRFRNEHRLRPIPWLLTQRKRIEAAWSFFTTKEQIDRILGNCNGELEHAVRCRLHDYSDFEKFMNIFEDIVTNTSVGKVAMRGDNNLRVTFTNQKDTKTSYAKETKAKEYAGNTSGTADQSSKQRPPFRNRDDKQRFDKKPIHAVSCEDDDFKFEEQIEDKDNQVDESKSDTSEDEGDEYCVRNVDMFLYKGNMMTSEVENQNVNTDEEETQNNTTSIEELGNNLREAETINSSVEPILFILQPITEFLEINSFLNISIKGFRGTMLVNTAILPSLVPAHLLERYWPTWKMDMHSYNEPRNQERPTNQTTYQNGTPREAMFRKYTILDSSR